MLSSLWELRLRSYLAEHPLTLTQRLQDEGEDEGSKRVTYVRPDITVVTANTSQLCDHYYHALLYWKVKIGNDLNKDFVQVVWALLAQDVRFRKRGAEGSDSRKRRKEL
jgi:hypothetical protein